MLNTNFDSWMQYFAGFLDEKTRIRYRKQLKGGSECRNGMFKVLLFLIIIAAGIYYMLK
tara:strand:+ start:371 stop:547 length:177 start_codon:yes stop_codon:yes gene_type:complete